MVAFIVSFYAAGARRPADGLGPFETRAAAVAYGEAELERVGALEPNAREPTIDWAHRFTVRAVRWS